MADTSLTYRLFGQDVSASKALDGVGKSAGKAGDDIEKHSSRSGAALSKLGGMAGTVAAGGVLALGAAVVQGTKDAASYQKLADQTAAVLKSTGNAAGTTVPHVQSLAGSLESLSGTDEELIINSQNVMATFTGIQNKAGANNDVFDQATKAALNLSTAMGSDLQGATVQVGKALNDPVKGITALSKVGVSFTQQQKDQIKAMVKSGDTMGAQKLILAELNKEFGGAAEAAGKGFAGSMARAQDAVGDAFRAVGTLLLPVLTKFADWIATKGVPMLMEFAHKVEPWMPVIQSVAHFLGTVLVAALKAVWAVLTNVVFPVIGKLAQVFMATVGIILTGAAKAFGWVPGIGPKLQAAANDFNAFRDQVNQSLAGIKDKDVNIYIHQQVLKTAGGQSVYSGAGNVRESRVQLRATGGPVIQGHPYIVGEQGMELFVPKSNGFVVPHDRLLGASRAGSALLGGGGPVVNVYVTQPLGTPDAIGRAVRDALRRGGNRGYGLGKA